MKNKSRIITCLSITDKVIKLVQSCPGRLVPEISAVQALSLAGKSDEELARGIKSLFSSLKQKDPGRLILMIPRQMAAMHYARFPSTNPEELFQMARLQAPKQIPYDSKEIIFGYQVVRVNPDGYSDIVLIIIHQDIVRRYIAALEKNKIEPDEVVIDSQGICRWLQLQQEFKADTGVIVVDLDTEHARLDIVLSGMFIYSRAFPVSLGSPDYRMRLSEEINRSLFAYQNETSMVKPAEAVFTGSSEYLERIDDDLLNSLPFKSVKYPQDKAIQLKNSSQIKLENFKRISFTSLIGAVCSQKKPLFNLLPEDLLAKRGKAAYKLEIRKTAVFIVLIIFAIASAMFMNISLRQSSAIRLGEELSRLSEDVGRIEKMARKITYVRSQDNRSGSCLDVFTEVFRVAQEEISLISFSYTLNKSLILKGRAKSLSGVFNFVSALEESPVFKDVQLRHSFERRVQGESLADFDITCQPEG
ncbi:MAG: PilN domain-containing protein [Candidatus Omnitrophota bacterium]